VRARIAAHAKKKVAREGFWRGALVLDFGKDLPAFCGKLHALPARDFVAEIIDAFRGRVVEIADFY
jgi:hypothetical protein